MKGAIYSRVSTKLQDYSKQTNELKEYAKSNGIDIVYVFEEKESGFNSDRPEYHKLKQLTKEDIDIVLVWEISRLSRKSIFLQQQFEDFENKGICIFCKKEGINTSRAADKASLKLMIAVLSSMAEMEAATYKERTVSGRRNKIQYQGHGYCAAPPYGYKKDPETQQLIIDEEQAAVVRRIFDMSVNQNMSAYRIAIVLNAEGIPTKTGVKNWINNSVNYILNNPVYTGKYLYAKDSKLSEKLGKEIDPFYVDTPALVSQEMFDRSKELTKGRQQTSTRLAKHNPLMRGLIICPDCHVHYKYSNLTGEYVCPAKYKKAKNGVKCHSRLISSKKIDVLVWNTVKAYFLSQIQQQKALETIEPFKEEVADTESLIKNLQYSLDGVTERAEVIVNAAIDIKIQFPDMLQLYEKKMEEVKELNKEAANIKKEITAKEANIKKLNRKIESITNASNTIDVTEEDEKYDIVHKMVDNAMIFGEVKDTLIVLTLITGQVIYIGYKVSKTRKYYNVIYPSVDVKFDVEKRKGYIREYEPTEGKFEIPVGAMKEYSIKEFLAILDIEENRRCY